MDTSISSTLYQKFNEPEKCVSTEPSISRREAVLAALSELQEKIRNLEMERNKSKRDLETLPQHVRLDDYGRKTFNFSTLTKDALESQMATAELRCKMLEHQINYMRKLLSKNTQKSGPSPVTSDRSAHNIEKRNFVSSLASTTKDNHESCTRNRCAACAAAVSRDHSLPKRKKDVKFNNELNEDGIVSKSTERSHYKLNLKRLPFVVAQSTSDSHSVTANVQQVFHLMNSYNSKLCSNSSKGNAVRDESSLPKNSVENDDRLSDRRYTDDLDSIINALKEEFSVMNFECQEMVRQIGESDNKDFRLDLEKEMEVIVESMTKKSEQIEKLKSFQKYKQRKYQKSPERTTSRCKTTLTRPRSTTQPTPLEILKSLKTLKSSLA